MSTLPATLGPFDISNRLDQRAIFTLPQVDYHAYSVANPRTGLAEQCAAATYEREWITLAPGDARTVTLRVALNRTTPQAVLSAVLARVAEAMGVFYLGADDGVGPEYPKVWPLYAALTIQTFLHAPYGGLDPRGGCRIVRLLTEDEDVATFGLWVPGSFA